MPRGGLQTCGLGARQDQAGRLAARFALRRSRWSLGWRSLDLRVSGFAPGTTESRWFLGVEHGETMVFVCGAPCLRQMPLPSLEGICGRKDQLPVEGTFCQVPC